MKLGILSVIALVLLAYGAGVGAVVGLNKTERAHKYMRSNLMLAVSLIGFGFALPLMITFGLYFGIYGIVATAFTSGFCYALFCWLARRR